ncbi:MAG: hypothetical protein AB1483_04325 [Candidatus Zixiibacteriota bacterium]
MRRFVMLMVVLALVATGKNTDGAETTVGGRIYADWMMDLTDGAESYNVFELSRVYVDVKSKLSDYTSLRATLDIRETDGFDGYSMILKYGFLDWKPKFANNVMTFRFGLQPTHYIDVMSDLWGRRYLEKVIADHRSLLTSSDLGAGLMFSFGEKNKNGYFAANVWNGTSYTKVEELNKQKDFSGFIIFKPLADNADFERTAIMGQAYFGTQNREFEEGESASDYDHSLISFGGMLGYRNTLDLGADININKEGQGPDAEDITENAFSFFGTLYFEDMVAAESLLRTLNLFGRVDMYDPNTDVDDNGRTYVMGGVECVPVKGFKASVNLRSVSYQAEGVDSDTYLYFNTEVKF